MQNCQSSDKFVEAICYIYLKNKHGSFTKFCSLYSLQTFPNI